MSIPDVSNYAAKTFNDKNSVKRWLQQNRLKTAVKLIEPSFRPNCIVDYGSGNGEIVKLLSARYPDASIICFEPTPELMDEARSNLSGLQNVQFTDCTDTISSASVDLLFCLEVFEHLPTKETEDAFAVFKRILSDQGKAVIGLPVEVGLPSLYKGAFRMVRRFGAYDATLGNIIRSALYAPPNDRPCDEIAPGFNYHFAHMGFDYRYFKSALNAHFDIECVKAGPFPAFGPFINPEINFLARPKA